MVTETEKLRINIEAIGKATIDATSKALNFLGKQLRGIEDVFFDLKKFGPAQFFSNVSQGAFVLSNNLKKLDITPFTKGLIGLIEINQILGPALILLGDSLASLDSKILKVTGTTIKWASVIAGVLLIALERFLTVTSSLISSVGNKLVAFFSEASNGAIKFEKQIVATTKTIEAFDRVTNGNVGSVESWSKEIRGISKDFGILEGSLQKETQEIVAIGSQYGFNEEQLKKLLNVTAAYAKINEKDVFDVSVKIASALAGNAQAVANLGIKLNSTALQTKLYKEGTGQLLSELNEVEKAQLRFNKLVDQYNIIAPTATAVSKTLAAEQDKAAVNLEKINREFGKGAAIIERNKVQFLLFNSVANNVNETLLNVIGAFGALTARLAQVIGFVGKFILKFLFLTTVIKILLKFRTVLFAVLKGIAAFTGLTALGAIFIKFGAIILVVVAAFTALAKTFRFLEDQTRVFSTLWGVFLNVFNSTVSILQPVFDGFRSFGNLLLKLGRQVIGLLVVGFAKLIGSIIELALKSDLIRDKLGKENVKALEALNSRLDMTSEKLIKAKFDVGTFAEENKKVKPIIEDNSFALKSFGDDLDDVGEKTKSFNEKLEDSFADLQESYLDTFSQLESGFSNAFNSLENSLVGFIDGTKSAKEAFTDFANSVVNDLLKIAVRQAVLAPLAGGLSGLFSGASATPTNTSLGSSQGGFLVPNANGNAFNSNGIVPFQNGGIVSSPTMFGFGNNKLGVMGEKGSEAILPLQRDSQGRLGVSGGGSQTIVNVINNSSQNTEVNESTGANGERVVDVIIQSAVKKGINNGAFDKSFSNSFGISRQGRV